MPVSTRKMDSILVQVLGFERRTGRHLIYVLRLGGRQVARTLISHGVHEIDGDLLAAIARQMNITPAQLAAIIAGDLDRDAYYELLRQKGLC
jgi:hypothetical protein